MNNARTKATLAISTFALLTLVGLTDASAQTSNGTKSNPESKPQSVNNGGNGNPGTSTSNSNKNNGNPSSNGSNGNPGTSTSASNGSNGNPGTSTSNSNKNNGNPASNGSNGNPGMSKPSASNGSNGNPGTNDSNSNKNNGNPSSNGSNGNPGTSTSNSSNGSNGNPGNSNGNPGNSNGNPGNSNKNNGNPGNSNPSIREIVSDPSVGMMQMPNGEVVHIVKGDEGSMHSANLSKPVRNLVMKVASSSRESESVLIFDQDFVIDTQDANCGEAGLLRGCLVKEGNVLRVLGGTGTIRFTSKTSNVSWTAVSTDEDLKVNFGIPQVIWAMPER